LINRWKTPNSWVDLLHPTQMVRFVAAGFEVAAVEPKARAPPPTTAS
jgi:hypothetical protein